MIKSICLLTILHFQCENSPPNLQTLTLLLEGCFLLLVPKHSLPIRTDFISPQVLSHNVACSSELKCRIMVCRRNLKATAKNDFSIYKLKTSLNHTKLCTFLCCFQILLWDSSLHGSWVWMDFVMTKKSLTKFFAHMNFKDRGKEWFVFRLCDTFRMDMKSLTCFSNRESLAIQWCFSTMDF